jgi:N-acetyl-anhydromuramyl-L-alanine amidase AmpD
VFGVERENVGTGAEPWRPDQTETAAKVHAALISTHGADASLVCEHKEWAPNRKIDAFGVDGSQMRALVAKYLHPSVVVESKPNIDSSNFLQTVDNAAKKKPVLKRGNRGAGVIDLQKTLNTIVGKKVLAEDGDFGAATERWVKQFQKDHNLRSNGIVDYSTWVQLIVARLRKV